MINVGYSHFITQSGSDEQKWHITKPNCYFYSAYYCRSQLWIVKIRNSRIQNEIKAKRKRHQIFKKLIALAIIPSRRTSNQLVEQTDKNQLMQTMFITENILTQKISHKHNFVVHFDHGYNSMADYVKWQSNVLFLSQFAKLYPALLYDRFSAAVLQGQLILGHITDDMARDLLRDLIFIVFIACFIYSVHNAALKLMARTKSVKSR